MHLIKSKKLKIASLLFVVLALSGIVLLLLLNGSTTDNSSTTDVSDDFIEEPVELGFIEYEETEYILSIQDPQERYSRLVQQSQTALFNGDTAIAIEFGVLAFNSNDIEQGIKDSDLYSLYQTVVDIDESAASEIVSLLTQEKINELNNRYQLLEESL